MCFATDPFMYEQKEIIDLSLKIIKRLNIDSIKVVSISKGVYPKELVNTEKYGSNNEYGSTIVSLSEDFRKKFEPHAAPLSERIKSLKKLHDEGLKTWVSMEPYPTPNITKQNVEDVLEKISFVDEIVFGKWNYNKIISSYDQYKSFYNYNSLKVIEFCNRYGIKYHIKKGTWNDERANVDFLNYSLSLRKIADKLVF